MVRSEDLCALRTAGLWTLLVLQAVMAAALFSRTPPHPPLAVAPFAMAPFLAASLAIAAAAISLQARSGRTASWLALLAGLLALVSYGPQKWLDPAIAQIWPAVLIGEVAAVAVLATSLPALRRQTAS